MSSCSGRHRYDNRPARYTSSTEQQSTAARSRSGATVIPLTPANGVYYITVKLNDVPMKFVFDTGASAISLSLVEAQFLIKQGTLTEDDVEGSAYFYDANGDATESLIVNIRKVEIGGRVIENVRASIVPNQEAPLLLGQSLLQKLGTITIDNNKNQLIIK